MLPTSNAHKNCGSQTPIRVQRDWFVIGGMHAENMPPSATLDPGIIPWQRWAINGANGWVTHHGHSRPNLLDKSGTFDTAGSRVIFRRHWCMETCLQRSLTAWWWTWNYNDQQTDSPLPSPKLQCIYAWPLCVGLTKYYNRIEATFYCSNTDSSTCEVHSTILGFRNLSNRWGR